jgi:type IV pilus assembly protein PilN
MNQENYVLLLLIGVGVGAGLLALTGLLGLIVGWQTGETQSKIQQLDGELGQLQVQSKKIEDLKGQLTALEGENQALVTVFNQIRILVSYSSRNSPTNSP